MSHLTNSNSKSFVSDYSSKIISPVCQILRANILTLGKVDSYRSKEAKMGHKVLQRTDNNSLRVTRVFKSLL